MTARRRSGRSGWSFVYDLPSGADGKRRQRSKAGFRTKKEAEQAERDDRALLAQGVIISGDKLTVGDYLAQWLAHKKGSVEYMTYVGYEGFIRLHLGPAIGRIEMLKLRPLEIQSALRRITDAGLTANTAHHAYTTIKLALDQAVQWQLIARNPAEAVQAPRVLPSIAKTASLPELRKLLAEADKTPHGPVFRLIAMTGLRRGEALGLHWPNVSLDATPAVLAVKEAAQRQGPETGIVFKYPKRKASARLVMLLPETVEMLREQRRRQVEHLNAEWRDYQDRGLVFADSLGGAIDGNNLSRTWVAVRQAAGVGHITIHGLRHTHATLLLQAGVHPKIVQERLGHASIQITMNLYSHVTPTMQGDAIDKLGRMLQE